MTHRGRRLVFLALLAVLLAGGAAKGEAAPSAGESDVQIVLTFGGDCVLGPREEWKGDKDTFDTVIAEKGDEWCFEKIAEPFQTDDMSLVNLECVLQKNGRGLVRDKQYRFRGDPANTRILAAAGIEQVNLANNHYIDYGATGRRSTQKALKDGGIGFSGYGQLFTYEKDDIKIGFGGCRETVYEQNPKIVQEDIRKLQKMGCDVIVYSCHWGKEYSPKHNRTQTKMAEYVIRQGADLVIGTHPHCVQGMEAVNGAPVVYSLGNLVFGGTHEMRTFDAYLLRATLHFGPEGYQGVELQPLPVLTSSDIPRNNFRPEFAEGDDRLRIMKQIQNDSRFQVTDRMWFPAKPKKKK